jgi:type IV pilus assembly protein PilA
MFLQNLRAKVGARLNGDSEAGFTLIELLVVMLILGILAAIAIPAFFNQREKATDAQAKAAARTAETAIETYATENGGSYVGATNTKLSEIEPTLQTAGNNRIVVPAEGLGTKKFKVESISATTVGFSIERLENGTLKFDCTSHGKSGCPSTGEWNK